MADRAHRQPHAVAPPHELPGADTLKAGLNYAPWYSTDTTRLAWNALGQLVRAEHWNAGGAHTVDSLFYDALGRRVAKQVNGVTTWYVYDGDQIVLDVMASTGAMVAEYAYLGSSDLFGMRTPTDTLVALRTATNGTIVGMARARDGVEVKRYPVLNTPWSQQMPDTGLVVRFRMGGQEYDQETGLYHLGARYYDPQIGRFLSEDPIGIAGGLNLYAYAGNDPINYRDPSGLDFQCVRLPVYNYTWSVEHGYEQSGIDHWETSCWDDGNDATTIGDATLDFGGPGGGATGGAPGSAGLAITPPKAQAEPDSSESCRDAKLLFWGSVVSDAGFFATGGLEGIALLGRAGYLGLKGLLRSAPLVGKLEYAFARGSLANGLALVTGAYFGTRGVGIAGVASLNAAGVLTVGSNVGGVAVSFIPVAGSIKAYLDMRAACGP